MKKLLVFAFCLGALSFTLYAQDIKIDPEEARKVELNFTEKLKKKFNEPNFGYNPVVFETETYYEYWRKYEYTDGEFEEDRKFSTVPLSEGLMAISGYRQCKAVLLSKNWLLMPTECYAKADIYTDSYDSAGTKDPLGGYIYRFEPISITFKYDGRQVRIDVRNENVKNGTFDYKLPFHNNVETGLMLLNVSNVCLETTKTQRTGFCGTMVDLFSDANKYAFPANYGTYVLANMDNPSEYAESFTKRRFFTPSNKTVGIDSVKGRELMSTEKGNVPAGEPLYFNNNGKNMLTAIHMPDYAGFEKGPRKNKNARSYITFGKGFTSLLKKVNDKNIVLFEDFNLQIPAK